MQLSAQWIGHRVRFPTSPAVLRVSGVTSRGIFALIEPEELVFFSYENQRGPLTINLDGGPIPAAVGETAALAGMRVHFQRGLYLNLGTARIWRPPIPPQMQLAPEIHLNFLRAVGLEILASRPGDGLAPLLGPLLDLPFPPLPSELAAAQDCLVSLRHGADLPAALRPILGLGRGLTPSGDDFAAGYLLARVRSGRQIPPDLSLALTILARERTTLLSAALLEAAAAGSADERLIAACDALVSGLGNPQDILTLLTSYGNSSGLDAFAGFVAYFKLT